MILTLIIGAQVPFWVAFVILSGIRANGWLTLESLVVLLFCLGLGMPTLCQVCSKLSEPGETVVSASVLCALFYSTFVENLRTDVLAFTVAPVPQRRR